MRPQFTFVLSAVQLGTIKNLAQLGAVLERNASSAGTEHCTHCSKILENQL